MTKSLLLHPRTERIFAKLQDKLPHALIIEGPSGVGTRTIAMALAESKGRTVFVIEPKKSVNGQMVIDGKEGNVIIEDIRLLYERTRTSQPDSHVYILDTGERSMTTAAQNAFLKLLEEPRAGLHFIIATHHLDQLLPTIRSRAQVFSLLPITVQQTKTQINNLAIEDPVMQARLAFVGQGLPALTARLASDNKAYDERVAIMSDAKTLIGGSAYEKLVVAHRYRDNRAGALTLLDDANHQLRVLVLKTPDPGLVRAIERHLQAREKIAMNGNIRLQLASAVL